MTCHRGDVLGNEEGGNRLTARWTFCGLLSSLESDLHFICHVSPVVFQVQRADKGLERRQC